MKIELQDIHKHFGPVRANDGISLDIESGVIQGLLGENGAGKTTLMKILSGYQPCDQGAILLDGRLVCFRSPADAIQAGIGMLHQDPLDVPAFSVLDNFMLGQSVVDRRDRGAARRELASLCARFGFSLDLDAQTGSLTVGERQQLEIVRLLALGVRVIILDEPTTGISAPQKALLFQALQQLSRDGLAVVFVSHKLEEVEALCAQVTVLRQGQVAGQLTEPFDADDLVALMFGQALGRYEREQAPLGDTTLRLQDAEVRTYRLQLTRMNLTVKAGEVIGIAGLEGSGQRLMMQACAGIQRLRAGRIFVGERDMTAQPYTAFLQEGVAFVPAARLEEGMVPGMTLREHVALSDGTANLFIDWERADKRAQQMITDYNIIGQPQSRVESLSGGNQQRALLALLPERLRLLIVEHPTRGLDIGSTRWTWHKLLQRRLDGTAIMFTSTDLEELAEYSDRIVVFSGGTMSAPRDVTAVTVEELGNLIGGRGL
jgi:simple sugar transport system ATP-binding protein